MKVKFTMAHLHNICNNTDCCLVCFKFWQFRNVLNRSVLKARRERKKEKKKGRNDELYNVLKHFGERKPVCIKLAMKSRPVHTVVDNVSE